MMIVLKLILSVAFGGVLAILWAVLVSFVVVVVAADARKDLIRKLLYNNGRAMTADQIAARLQYKRVWWLRVILYRLVKQAYLESDVGNGVRWYTLTPSSRVDMERMMTG